MFANMDRIQFENRERQYLADNIGNAMLVVDSCHLSEQWRKVEKRLATLLGGARSIDEVWPLRLPPAPPDVEFITYLFNKNFVLVSIFDHHTSPGPGRALKSHRQHKIIIKANRRQCGRQRVH